MRINKSFPLLLLALLLTSCVVRASLKDLKDLNDIEAVPAREALVLGRLNVIDEGQPLNFRPRGSLLFRFPPFRIHIISDAGQDPVAYSYTPSGDGSFFWDLPSGGYVITEFVQRLWPEPEVRRSILARFVVPEASAPIYIGTLTIREEAGRYTMRVEDHYDQALQRLKGRFPEISGPVTKRLMELR